MRQLVKAIAFVLLLMLTTISLPTKSLNILASDTDLSDVTIIDSDKSRKYRTGSRTVEEVLNEMGITVGSKDYCDRGPQDSITGGMTITITRGPIVNVHIDGVMEKRKVYPGTTTDKLIAELQDEHEVALLYEGETNRELEDGITLKLTTWRSVNITYAEEIPYEKQSIETTALTQGDVRVRQTGVPGKRQITEAIIYIGGQEHRREMVEDVIVSEPLPEITDIGIGGMLGTLTDVNSPSFYYEDKMTMRATAYTAGYESTGKNPGDPGYGITSSGEPVRQGIVAVDEDVIPLGTSLYVDGYGYSLAADTGGAIKGDRIDLYLESEEDAKRFGRKTLDVYILE